MTRRKAVLSVTVTSDCLVALNEFLAEEERAGWATNKSQVVNNAVMEFIARNKNRKSAVPSSFHQLKQGNDNESAT
jgi:hypothetical protein